MQSYILCLQNDVSPVLRIHHPIPTVVPLSGIVPNDRDLIAKNTGLAEEGVRGFAEETLLEFRRQNAFKHITSKWRITL